MHQLVIASATELSFSQKNSDEYKERKFESELYSCIQLLLILQGFEIWNFKTRNNRWESLLSLVIF